MLLLGGLCVVAAVLGALVGGLDGPLAPLCLLPLAAALGRDAREIALGVGFSWIAAAVLVIAEAAGLPSREVSGWYGLVLALGALLAVTHVAMLRAVAGAQKLTGRAERAEAQAARLERLLLEQPGLLLTADRSGKVGAAYGEAPWGISGPVLFKEGLAAAAAPPDRPALLAALAEAVQWGDAELSFAPAGQPHRTVFARLHRMRTGRLAIALHELDAVAGRVREAEAERDRALDANAAKSRFLAGMSHELRTPLNAILGFADAMRQQVFGPLPARYATYPDAIHEAGSHLLDLINDVLDLSKIEADRYQLRPELHDAREPIRAALGILRGQADEAGVALDADLPSEPVMVIADQRALKQIVFNLAGNALKFTPARGRALVALDSQAGVALLRVADTGVGISPEDLERLGRPYEQAGDESSQARGTGLGLSLVRALAHLQGGTMTIESALGQGSVFTVRLPILAGEADAEADLPDNVVRFAAKG